MNIRAACLASGGAAGLVMVSLLTSSAFAAKGRPTPPAVALGSFTDHLDVHDTTRWMKADGWTNGSPFANAWKGDHVTFGAGSMELRLDGESNLGMPYTSGEYRTTGFYGYGCYEARFKAVRRPGVVTAFFTFAGPYDNGGNGKHNEIDVEFLGNDTTRVQFNFWTNDDTYSSRNEYLHALGFDAADGFHTYGFHWHAGGIQWFVDGHAVYEVEDGPVIPTPKISDSVHKVMMNLWPVDATASGWAGEFSYPGEPLRAGYEWTRYSKDVSCDGLAPPLAPQPPSGNASAMHVEDVAVSLNAQRTQAIARVVVLNGLGQPIPGVNVSALWSGAITRGDLLRTTDANGVATFYSARSSATGTVSFCVSGMTLGSYAYQPGTNRETCASISK
jgi:endo-1,3-1,4-beta-glycanase ExoK